MLDPLPPFPDPYTPALGAYLAEHPLSEQPPTAPSMRGLLTLFQQSCAQNDLATAVRVLALPLAGRPLHYWLLERDELTQHLQLTEQLAHHPQAAALSAPERAFLTTAQADRLIYHLPPLPVPGDLIEDAGEFSPPPPPDVVAPPTDATTAIGLYRLAYRLYTDADAPLPALACLHRLIELSLQDRQEVRLIEAAGWAKQGITRSQHLHLPAETAHFLYQLALIQNLLDEDLAAHLSLLQLLRLPAPGAATPIRHRAWRFLGYLYEFHGDLIDAMVCYLKTLPPTEHPPRAETLPLYVSGVLAAFELSEGQDVVNQAFARLRDPAWTPQPFPATSLPPFPEAIGELDDGLDPLP